jgi:DNA-nicking Smr family endonuclease
MSKSKDPDDMDLFREMMRGVKKLPAAKPRVTAEQKPDPEEKMNWDDVGTPPKTKSVDAPELKSGKNHGVDASTFEKFRRGHMNIDSTLDLHGLTQAEAHAALKKFIPNCADAGDRCVLIITGKGGARREDTMEKTGVLRENLPKWLNGADLRPKILSLSPAQPRHGGSGAFYVLLKRRRDG